jgi:hypothetical protein
MHGHEIGLERLGLALRSASAAVEEPMLPVSAALDFRLGKLAHWGDSQLGIAWLSVYMGNRIPTIK